MIKTPEELKAQAALKGITFYPVHDCSICGVTCGYVIDGDKVGYDSSCNCGAPEFGIQERDWDDLARTYNCNQPENNPDIMQSFLDKLNQTWQFEPEKGPEHE